jgi:type I restriction enzyme, S subunit
MSLDALSVGEPNVLPVGWAWVQLGQIGSWIGGGTPSKSAAAYWANGSIPWVSPKDMKAEIIQDTEDHITEAAVASSATKFVPAGSVLMVMRSGILRHTFPVAVNADRVTVNQDLRALIPAEGISPRYVAHYLRGIQRQVLDRCSKDGTTVQSIEVSALERIRVPIAPAAQQRRIVARIDELFAEITEGDAALRRARQGLATWRRSLLKAAVTGELTRDWREANRPTETGADLLARIRAEQDTSTHASRRRRPAGSIDTDSPPTLPEGWIWSSVGDLFEVTTGSTPSRAEPSYWGGTIPWVSSGEVASCRIKKTRECITSLALRGSSNRIHPPGTVLLAMIGEGKTRGQCAILDIAACNNQNSAAIRVSSTPIVPEYIYHVLQERYYRSRKESQGGNQPALNGQKVASIVIPLPSLDEIGEVVRRLDYFSIIAEEAEHECAEANATQSKLRQSILKAAFEGRLVPQDPADEPASVLLVRLRGCGPGKGARRWRARAAADFSHSSLPGLSRQSVDPWVAPAGDE